MDLGECAMALMKVLDKSTDKYINIKIDVDDLDRLKDYKYVTDRNHAKPFREEKIEGYVRRIFLARDVMGFSFGDKRVVSYKNGDIFDLRKENLVEGRTTVAEQKSNTGNFWPHTFKSLVNFLDKRKGVDEELATNFLLKALKIKYTRKRIDLIFGEKDYDDYKNKNAQVVILRVLNKHFEWGGQVVAAKDITKQIQQQIKVIEEKITLPEKMIEREVVKETSLELPPWDKWEANFKRHSESNKMKLIELISKYLPFEDLIEIVIEKGSKMAMTIQFNRKV
jgi:hypothetical protein